MPVVLPLQIQDGAAGNELQRPLGCGEVEIRAGMYQRRAADADVHLPRPVSAEYLHVVPELGAAHDGVVAEHDLAVLHLAVIGNQLHLGNHVAGSLVHRHEAAGPRGGILEHRVAVRDAGAFCIAQRHTGARVGNRRHKVGLQPVLLAHEAPQIAAGMVHVHPLVRGCRKAVIYPEERADVQLALRREYLLDAVGGNLDRLAGTELSLELIVEIDHAEALAGHHIAVVALAYRQRSASVPVTGRYDAVVGKDQQGAGSLYLALHIADALCEILSLVDQLRHYFGSVYRAVAKLGEDRALRHEFRCKLLCIGEFHHRADSEAAQVRMHRDGLRLAVADGSDTAAAVELSQVGLELNPEIRLFEAMDAAYQRTILVDHCHSSSLCPQMGMIVNPIEQIGYTLLFGDNSE